MLSLEGKKSAREDADGAGRRRHLDGAKTQDLIPARHVGPPPPQHPQTFHMPLLPHPRPHPRPHPHSHPHPHPHRPKRRTHRIKGVHTTQCEQKQTSGGRDWSVTSGRGAGGRGAGGKGAHVLPAAQASGPCLAPRPVSPSRSRAPARTRPRPRPRAHTNTYEPSWQQGRRRTCRRGSRR